MKIHKEDIDIPASQMQDGDIGVITSWAVTPYIGTVVQKFGRYLISLGKPSGESWDSNWDQPKHNRVRILPPGTLLEI